MSKRITFTAINLSRHADLCVCFRRDSYQCSFVDGAQRFNQENGKDGKKYLNWLEKRIAELSLLLVALLALNAPLRLPLPRKKLALLWLDSEKAKVPNPSG